MHILDRIVHVIHKALPPCHNLGASESHRVSDGNLEGHYQKLVNVD